MDKYPPGTTPSEAGRSSNGPHCRFRVANGKHGTDDHTWQVSCIRMMFIRNNDTKRCLAIFRIDPTDDSIAVGLRTLMTREDETPAEEIGQYAGLGRLLCHTFYLINWVWEIFLVEAESHLKILVSIKMASHQVLADSVERRMRGRGPYIHTATPVHAGTASIVVTVAPCATTSICNEGSGGANDIASVLRHFRRGNILRCI
jgi:hypothetical protein